MHADCNDQDWHRLVVWLEMICSLIIEDEDFLFATQFGPAIQLLLNQQVGKTETVSHWFYALVGYKYQYRHSFVILIA